MKCGRVIKLPGIFGIDKMDDLKFSVCIPIYNSASLIGPTLESILAQSFTNYEIIISDNNSQDNTEEVVRSFNDERVKYFKNECNVGYTQNLELSLQRANGDIIYLMSAKSKLAKDALLDTCNAFKLSDDIGAVTRPYYWYGKNIGNPIRAKGRYAKGKDAIISIHDGEEAVIAVLKTLDNPGGLAYRKKYMDTPFNKDPFVEFTYPFVSIFKKHKVVLLKDYTMACPAFEYSGSQSLVAYKKSPIQNWVDLFNNVFFEKEFEEIKKKCIKNFVAVNYIGLVQIKNYSGKYACLLKEISLLVKYRWKNLFNFKFWFFSLGTMILPQSILIPLVAIYKNKINSKIVESKIKDICLKI